MAYKYQYNPGIQDNISLRSAKSNRSRNGTLRRYEIRYEKRDRRNLFLSFFLAPMPSLSVNSFDFDDLKAGKHIICVEKDQSQSELTVITDIIKACSKGIT